MGKKLRWRVLLIVLVVAGAVGGLSLDGLLARQEGMDGAGRPSIKDALKKAIKLGLDLRGGIHLVLQVNTADAVKAERDDAVETLKSRDEGRGHRRRRAADGQPFSVAITPQTDQAKLDDAVQALPAGLELLDRPAESGPSP